jgi:hypothetical protein
LLPFARLRETDEMLDQKTDRFLVLPPSFDDPCV